MASFFFFDFRSHGLSKPVCCDGEALSKDKKDEMPLFIRACAFVEPIHFVTLLFFPLSIVRPEYVVCATVSRDKDPLPRGFYAFVFFFFAPIETRMITPYTL